MTPSDLSPLAGRVLHSLRTYGAWERDALAAAQGVQDRTIREAVTELRLAGEPIVSSSGGGGYRLTADPEELRECAEREYGSRARTLLTIRSEMRKAATRLQQEREGARQDQMEMAL